MSGFPDSTESQVAELSGRQQKGAQDWALGHPYLKVEQTEGHQQKEQEGVASEEDPDASLSTLTLHLFPGALDPPRPTLLVPAPQFSTVGQSTAIHTDPQTRGWNLLSPILSNPSPKSLSSVPSSPTTTA